MSAFRDAYEAVRDLDGARRGEAIDKALGRQRDEVDEKTDGSDNLEAKCRVLLDNGAGGRHQHRLEDDGKGGKRSAESGRDDEDEECGRGAL
jgi:hypothetical protein